MLDDFLLNRMPGLLAALLLLLCLVCCFALQAEVDQLRRYDERIRKHVNEMEEKIFLPENLQPLPPAEFRTAR